MTDFNTINYHPSKDINILHHHDGDFSWFTTCTVPTYHQWSFFRLPCVVDRLEGFVMLWKKNGEIITVASQIIDKVCDNYDYNNDNVNGNDDDEEDNDDAEVITVAI